MYAKNPTLENKLVYNEWVDSMCVYVLHDVSCCIRTDTEEEDKSQRGTFIIKQE